MRTTTLGLTLRGASKRAFGTGLTVYAVSFFLIAVGPEPHPGWNCALSALFVPGVQPQSPVAPTGWLNRIDPGLLAVKISGLINVVFLLTVLLGLGQTRSWRASFRVLRIGVLLMMPFCWVAFRAMDLFPREGYFVWTAAMISVLFSGRLGRLPSVGGSDVGRATLIAPAISNRP